MLVTVGCTGSSTSPSVDEPEPAHSSAVVINRGGDADLSAALDAEITSDDSRYGNVRAVIVIRRGHTLVENYYRSQPTDHHSIYSITKSVVSTLVGIAASDRLLSLDDSVAELLPAYRSLTSRQAAEVTLRQLLTMSGGFPEASTAFMGAPNPIESILRYGLDRPPGTGFAYSDQSAHLVGAILTAATGQPLLGYARSRLFDPLGIDTRPAFTPTATSYFSLLDVPRYTRAQSGFAWPTDKQGIHLGYAWIKLTPADLATLGELYLHQGRWNGRQIVPSAWVSEATSTHITLEDGQGYGYMWWTETVSGHRSFGAAGSGGQLITVAPDLDLVVVSASDLDGMTANPVEPYELSGEILAVVFPAVD